MGLTWRGHSAESSVIEDARCSVVGGPAGPSRAGVWAAETSSTLCAVAKGKRLEPAKSQEHRLREDVANRILAVQCLVPLDAIGDREPLLTKPR